MTTLIRPFRGLRPAPGRAADVAAPPYDVLNADEARERAAGRPFSFLHVSRPEIDLPAGTDPYAPEVYTKGAENLRRMIETGVLVRDSAPALYAYRLRMGAHEQTGLVCVASVADYDSNRIRKHEFTRPKKEDDRVRQITALNAQTGPVLLAYQSHADIASILQSVTASAPESVVTAADGIEHTVWAIGDDTAITRLVGLFDAMPSLYIADGHHRSAAASRVAATMRGDKTPGSEDYEYFLCVAFPHDEMQILDYNRVVRDLNGLTAQEVLSRATEGFTVESNDGQVRPASPGEFGLYLDGAWHRLRIRPDRVPGDPVGRLDVSLLQDNLIGPLFNIGDPRTDDRVDFVGGIRGLGELERRVDSGEMAAAVALFPTRMEDLMAVADAGEVMPPKSTWFEPKLADGLVSHVLD